MLHYTINSANTFDCRSKKYNSGVFRLLKPLVTRAIAEGATLPLPAPFTGYRCKITVDSSGAALFDLYDPESCLLTVNAVAWTEGGQEAVWEMFENLYLKLSREFDTLSVSRAPVCPESLPWLTTLILPNPRMGDWVADFEQCLALTLIRELQPQKKGGKGFGT